MLKKVFVHSFLYAIAPIFIQASSLLLLPFLTPHLSSLDYGIYGIITSYLFFVIALRDLGLGVVFVNTFYHHPKRWKIIWRMIYGHLIIWMPFYVLLQLFVIYLALPQTELKNFKFILPLTILPAAIFDTANMISNYYYRFSEKPKVVATIGILSGIFSLGVTYYSIVFLKLGYLGWFIGTFSASLVAFLCYLYPVYIKLRLLPIISFRKKFISRYLRISLPMIPHNYSSYLLNSSDRIVMDLFHINIRQIGLYNIAYRFGSAFEMMGEAVGMAVGPQYVKLYSARSRKGLLEARHLTFALMICFVSVAFTISLWLNEVFNLLIRNVELQKAYDVGIIIIMGSCFRPMYWAVVNKLSTFGKTAVLWRISFTAGLINLLLNIIFIQQYGIYAAAIITFISLMFVGFSGFYLKVYKRLDNLEHFPLLWMITISVLTMLVFYLRDASTTTKLILSIIIVAIAILCLLKMKIKSYSLGDHE